MIENLKILAIIPARGGSKGVPGKNIRSLSGKPLLAWTIETAKKSKYIDRLILSSDDETIIRVAKEWGCEVPFVRPKELALDTTPGIDPVLHAIEEIPDYDYVVLLQPTSPLRNTEDIDQAIELSVKNTASCVSVVKQDNSPYWMYELNDINKMKPLIQQTGSYYQRQKLPDVYSLNGAIYVTRVEHLLKTKSFITEDTVAYVMPRERSIDIDEELDFIVAESFMSMNRKS